MSNVSTPALAAKSSLADRIGFVVSGVCVVHCLLVPAVIATLPLWPLADVLHGWLHPVFALILVPSTLIAAVYGYRTHGRKPIVTLLMTGLAVVLAAGGWGFAHPGAIVETAMTLAGSGLLITGHWCNWRADRCCEEAIACTTHTDHDH